jgi:hypothetical protein
LINISYIRYKGNVFRHVREHRLRVFENGVLRRIFGPSRDEMRGGCIQHVLSAKYSWNDKVEKDGIGKACSMNGGKRNAYMLLVGKPEGKEPLGRPRRIWADNIKMDLEVTRWGSVDWIGLVQDRDYWRALVRTVMKLRVP